MDDLVFLDRKKNFFLFIYMNLFFLFRPGFPGLNGQSGLPGLPGTKVNLIIQYLLSFIFFLYRVNEVKVLLQ